MTAALPAEAAEKISAVIPLKRLGEAFLIASECGKLGGCILPDVYHLYKGGSDFAGLKLIGGAAIGIFHVNDYPKKDRGTISDADRVYPGDGIAPLDPGHPHDLAARVTHALGLLVGEERVEALLATATGGRPLARPSVRS